MKKKMMKKTKKRKEYREIHIYNTVYMDSDT